MIDSTRLELVGAACGYYYCRTTFEPGFCLQQLGCELLVNSHGSVLIILPTVISYDQA
jgi:hypothetical protein